MCNPHPLRYFAIFERHSTSSTNGYQNRSVPIPYDLLPVLVCLSYDSPCSRHFQSSCLLIRYKANLPARQFKKLRPSTPSWLRSCRTSPSERAFSCLLPSSRLKAQRVDRMTNAGHILCVRLCFFASKKCVSSSVHALRMMVRAPSFRNKSFEAVVIYNDALRRRPGP